MARRTGRAAHLELFEFLLDRPRARVQLRERIDTLLILCPTAHLSFRKENGKSEADTRTPRHLDGVVLVLRC